MTRQPGSNPAPFLKWAGGKAAIAAAVAATCPPDAPSYHEPFLGGGAVFFALRRSRPRLQAYLNDLNADLIQCYRVVRDLPEALLAALGRRASEYLALEGESRAEYYYRSRDALPGDPVERAARLIFLNRTGYNGLYRVNSSGRFNVPHGRYRNPRIADRERILTASRDLQGTILTADDFEEACARARPGDFVYLDPPYRPLSATSRFTAYTAKDFGPDDQARLAAVFHDLAARGVRAILSNSDHPEVWELYGGRGYQIRRVPMPRSINSRGSGRTAIPELLISSQPAP